MMFFDSFPMSRERIERGQIAINTRNACHTEELEKYKNTLEKQHKRESSFLLFKQRKFVSRQEKILGKSFHTGKAKKESKTTEFPQIKPCQQEKFEERKMSDSRLSVRTHALEELKKESQRSLSAGCKISRDSRQIMKEKQFSNHVLSANESLDMKRLKEQDIKSLDDKDDRSHGQEMVKTLKSPEFSTNEQFETNCNLVRQNSAILLKNNRQEVTKQLFLAESSNVAQSETNENRFQNERLRIHRKSLSLPEIVCSNKTSEFLEPYDDNAKASKQIKKKSKKFRSKNNRQSKKRPLRSLVKSSSFPDVRTKTSKKSSEAKTLKSAEKAKRDSSLTLPRVGRKPSEEKPSKPEGSINLSVVCRVIRIKNTLTKRKKNKKQQEKVRKQEEITSEVWESLKSCRYLRIANSNVITESEVLA